MSEEKIELTQIPSHTTSSQTVPSQTALAQSARPSVIVTPADPCCSLECCNLTINKFCCKIYKDRNDIESMLLGIDLPPIQKQHIQSRYINILENLKKRSRKYSFVFFMGHFIITVGSLFVPALLSLQNATQSVSLSNGVSISVNSITFIVSLLVTIFNGILTLFKIDKKFYFLTTTVEKLRSEGWQFLGLTGRYSGRLNDMAPTHTNQFLYFSHQIEKIKMKQVEEEFYKSNDTSSDVRSNAAKQSELYPLSPMTAITDAVAQVPTPIKDVVQSIMKTQLGDGLVMKGITTMDSMIPAPSDTLSISIEPSNIIVDPSTPSLSFNPLYKGPVAIADTSSESF